MVEKSQGASRAIRLHREGLVPALVLAAVGSAFIGFLYGPYWLRTAATASEYWLAATPIAVLVIIVGCVVMLFFPKAAWKIVLAATILLLAGVFGWYFYDEWLETQPGGRGHRG